MESTASFGYWVRRQRKARDLTQQALADQVGCSLAAIKKIEQDERRPSRQIAERIAEVLGVPAGQREIFLEVARGVRPVDQLVVTHEPAAFALPSGTVTFLFTDIEGSTQLAQQHPEAMPALLARHHEILHQSIQTHNGYAFQVVGDEFAAAFHSTRDALHAALRAQHVLQKEAWSPAPMKVRMGIHTGAAQLQDVSNAFPYVGYATIALTQRIMSAAHGGQILLSHATENLLSGDLPNDVSLRDLGEHKFKDIQQAVRVFQVIAPDLQKEFPVLRARELSPNNLPIQLTSFVGREKEIAYVIRLLETARLVTLTGPGGTGKTRLSVQVANELLDQYPDGVWMVELAPILDPLLVPRTTANTVGLRDEPHRSVIDMLCDYSREKKMLILLDNCEHLIEACAQMADTLLHACPQIRILTTSREALGIAGETLYLVPSLTLPDVRNLPPLESLKQYEAIQLFVDRATSAIPAFTFTNKNAFSIAHICQRLDGIPLAIELVATKIRTLSPGQIAQRLDDRFHLLRGGSRTALPRHQTLQAAIDWSYNLLSPVEQTLFRRLSVFVGGWTLEVAESVCSDGDTTNRDTLKEENVLDLLTQLVNKSLVMTEEQNGEVRYHMLETIRQFGSDKLLETNENGPLGDRHLEHFLQLAETAAPHLIRPEQVEWLDRLEAEHDNLCAALGWSLGKERPDYALRLAASLGTFWNMHCHWKEGTRWLELTLAMPMEDPTPAEKTARARALYQNAALAANMDDLERLYDSAEASLTLCRQGTEHLDLAISQFYVGLAYYLMYDDQAGRLLEQSLAAFSELKQPYWDAQCQYWLSQIRFTKGEESYSTYATRNLEIAKETGDRLSITRTLPAQAEYAWENDRLKEANDYVEEAKHLYQELGSTIFTLNVEGRIAHASRNYHQARKLYSESIEHLELLGEKYLRSDTIEFLGILSKDEGKLAEAENHFQQALVLARERGIPTYISARLALLGQIHYLQGKVEEAKTNYRESMLFGKSFFTHRRKAQALIGLCTYLANRAPHLTTKLLSAVYSQDAKEIGRRPLNPFNRGDFDDSVALVRQILGESAFQAAWTQGENLGIAEAYDLALKTLDEV